MGLTGVILSARIALTPIETSFIAVEERRATSIEDLLNLLKEFDQKYLYTVGWIDLSGRFDGRGIVSGGNHANDLEIDTQYSRKNQKIRKSNFISVPDIFPSWAINRFTVRIFNFLWFNKPLQTGAVHYRKFMHPLDSIKDWNRIYGRKGFIQYQVQIPFGEETFFQLLLNELRRIDGVSFLGVVKQFGNFETRYLSFPTEGWTIALDLSLENHKIFSSLKFLDQELCKIGGKIYLTKDSRLAVDEFEKMYPKSKDWKVIKRRIDPGNYWQSDQGRRLDLC
jgi:decaprenylphospho-beta-D-ribofuranose 2-oxidase